MKTPFFEFTRLSINWSLKAGLVTMVLLTWCSCGWLSYEINEISSGSNASSLPKTIFTRLSGELGTTGQYGTKGVPSITSYPGARDAAVQWIAGSGEVWIFGGDGFDSAGDSGPLNDLWRYHPTTAEWEWVGGASTINQAGVYGTKGIANISNMPGARYGSLSWKDASGNFWLFGGTALDLNGNWGTMNDLWKFNPTTNEWTWISGSNVFGQVGTYGTKGQPSVSNNPGARTNAVEWLDADGNFWLFSGTGMDSTGTEGQLSDLWKYSPATNEWTWVSGSQLRNQGGTYGTKKVAHADNTPGGRFGAMTWVGADGKLWLIGGWGYDSISIANYLNDLWYFDVGSTQWTWVSGSNSSDQDGIYGTKGFYSTNSVPGARWGSITWLGSDGHLWLFSGLGRDSVGRAGYLNDIWHFNIEKSQWMWVSGAKTHGAFCTCGTVNVANSNNIPGGRKGSLGWVDSNNKLWLFGGQGLGVSGNATHLNDLWYWVGE